MQKHVWVCAFIQKLIVYRRKPFAIIRSHYYMNRTAQSSAIRVKGQKWERDRHTNNVCQTYRLQTYRIGKINNNRNRRGCRFRFVNSWFHGKCIKCMTRTFLAFVCLAVDVVLCGPLWCVRVYATQISRYWKILSAKFITEMSSSS